VLEVQQAEEDDDVEEELFPEVDVAK